MVTEKEKDYAAYLVRYAVSNGLLIKPLKCEICGKETKKHLLSGHHDDYSKPLDVIWLCHKCHNKREQMLGHRQQFRKGIENINGKLNPESVIEIRKMAKTNKYTNVKIGQIFSVSERTVRDVVNNRTWTWI